MHVAGEGKEYISAERKKEIHRDQTQEHPEKTTYPAEWIRNKYVMLGERGLEYVLKQEILCWKR